DLFWSQLGITRFDLEFLNVNRGVVVLFHESLGNEDRVFEVVTAPRHESHQHVTTESEFAAICARPISDDLSLFYSLTHVNDGALIDTGVLVRPLELDQRVNVGCYLARDGAVNVVICLYDDAFRVDVIDHAVTLSSHNSTGVTSSNLLHPGANIRSFRAKQRHRLA